MARLGGIEITQRQMHCRAIVPTHKVADLPLMAIDVFWASGVAAQIVDDRRAFRPAHAIEMGRAFADIKRLHAAVWMGSHTGMRDGWIYFQQFDHFRGIAFCGTRHKGEVVH